MITGNRGEWSELYAFLKLLVDKRLDAAGPGFEKLQDVFYPIVKIIRTETEGTKSYTVVDDDQVSILDEVGEVTLVKSDDLKKKVKEIFKAISESSGPAFSIPVAEESIKKFRVNHLNAGNRLKEDLRLQIHDGKTGTEMTEGFSIKSFAGSAATLLNASGATNFIYEIKDLPDSDVEVINNLDGSSKVRDRIKTINDKGGKLVYVGLESDIFRKNLSKSDVIMPEILAYLLLLFYKNRGPSLRELIDAMVNDEVKILGKFTLDRSDYEHKIANLLHNVALGMVPNEIWDGSMRAHGGYIIVREDGELVGYHAYNADIFRKYLLDNTKLETASTSRHGFGTIYTDKGRKFMKLNLQIRFIK